MSRANTIIREAEPEDAAQLRHVYAASWRDAYSSVMPKAFLDARIRERPEDFWRQRCDFSAGMFVAATETRVLAYLTAENCTSLVRDKFKNHKRLGEVTELYVLPVHQNRGIGGELMRWAHQLFEGAGYEGYAIRTLTDNAGARRFYERHGGEVVFEGEISCGEDERLGTITYFWSLQPDETE